MVGPHSSQPSTTPTAAMAAPRCQAHPVTSAEDLGPGKKDDPSTTHLIPLSLLRIIAVSQLPNKLRAQFCFALLSIRFLLSVCCCRLASWKRRPICRGRRIRSSPLEEMAVLGARPFLSSALKPQSSTSCGTASIPSSSSLSCSGNFSGCLSSNAAEVNDRFWSSGRACSSSASGKLGGSSFRLAVVGRAGGSRPPAGARRPRITGPRRTAQDEQQQSDGPLLNGDIR